MPQNKYNRRSACVQDCTHTCTVHTTSLTHQYHSDLDNINFHFFFLLDLLDSIIFNFHTIENQANAKKKLTTMWIIVFIFANLSADSTNRSCKIHLFSDHSSTALHTACQSDDVFFFFFSIHKLLSSLQRNDSH